MAHQLGTVLRGRLPLFAGSDIFANAPVVISSQSAQGTNGTNNGWTVIMATSSAQKPIGVARDNAAAGAPVAVYDDGNVVRMLAGAGASVTLPAYIGVIGLSGATVNPVSLVPAQMPLYGPVSPGAGVAVGGSGPSVWAVGSAWENAAVGDQAAFRIEPRLLSGLVTA